MDEPSVSNAKHKSITGYQAFRAIWREFAGLSVATILGGAAVPFVAFVSKISPPWPPGIVASTALVELVTLMLAFQLLHNAGRQLVSRVLVGSASALFVAIFIYLAMFATLTYVIPTTGERLVQGFVCTTKAEHTFKDHCPLLTMDNMADYEYDQDQLWERWSVVVSELLIVFCWVIIFMLISLLIGTFLMFHSKNRDGRA